MTDATRRSYDAVAAQYLSQIGDELVGKPLDRALLQLVAELADGGPVLDVGAGPGHIAAHLAARGAHVIATDLSPTMCTYAGTPAFAADMTALPVRDASVAAIVCVYSVIHLDEPQRRGAYREFARVLRPGGSALVAFHTSDAETPAGGTKSFTTFLGADVDLTFRFLDPTAEAGMLGDAGLPVTARLEREPYPDAEHPSRRAYLLARRA